MFSVERCWLGHIETAGSRVVRIVEPESEVESIDWIRIAEIGIESENLIQQNCLDCRGEFSRAIGLQVTLIPRQSEILERGVRGAVGAKAAALDGEHIKSQTRANVICSDGQGIAEPSANDLYVSCGGRTARHTQAVDELGVGYQIKFCLASLSK